MKTIEQLKKQFKEKLVDGISEAMEAMVIEIPTNSSKYNTLLQLKAQHRKYKADWLGGLIDQAQANLEFNRLTAALIDFIEHLEVIDFEAAEATTPVDERIGKVCFRIPNVMLVKEKNECRVWISFDEATLLKSIEVQLDDELRDLRVSDTMGVELFDDSDDEDAFKIKTYDETIQPIEQDLLTHWEFRVTPLKVGTFPLIIRIIVVVEKNGKELKKTVVLEEEVKIISTPNKELAEAKELTGKVMQNMFVLPFSGDSGGGFGGGGTTAPSASAASSAVGAAASLFTAKKLAVAAAVLIGGLLLFWNIRNKEVGTPEISTSLCTDESHWLKISQSGDAQMLRDYLEQCPETKYLTDAKTLLNEWQNSSTNLSAIENDPVSEIALTEVQEPAITTESEELSGTTTTPESNAEPLPLSETNEVADPSKVTAKGLTDLLDVEPKDVVLLAAAAQKPLHPDCERKNKKKWEECTEERIRATVERYIDKSGKRLEGSIKVSFIITKEGKIAFAKTENNENLKLASTVFRGLGELPKFRPGQNSKGEPIDVRYLLPVRIK